MKIPEKYINEIQAKYKNKYLVSEFIKKDLAISYILYEIAKHLQENRISPFNDLVFKGGTLLAKSYLNYHRLSEDIDFTFKDSKRFEGKSRKGKQKSIRKFLKKELLPELKKICEKYDFIFDETEIDRFDEKKYCPIKNNEFFMRFNIYINQNETNPIKIEINFCDELIDKPQKIRIRHLSAKSEHLIYPLEELDILSYSISDTLSEKLRAVITRKGGIHERDILDLFLLHNLNHNCFIHREGNY